ncbi:hypothetical protein BAE44_0025884 [Dichanthelium oligosanthes]|uniref:Uncharacterized protein n=1 Tax=Dichanthelium oligosanthes TaxID=888268 RepID=A0A1E5UJS1_9POAL|nr:hypothetical protein BAE44_0025884 [Dichanthelium oligosanthes]
MFSSYSSYEVLVLKDDIMHNCRFFMEKNIGNGEPGDNSPCCKFVRKANVVEICQEFTEADKAKIEMWKWVKVTRTCENVLATGHDCAGYVVQPPDSVVDLM